MRILVTGGAGYIGSHTCVALLEAGHDVVVYDNLKNSSAGALERIQQITGRALAFIQGDIRDSAALDRLFQAHPPEVVFHFAGLKSVAESVRDPLAYYDTNVNGSLCLLRAMDRAGMRRLIFSSSATVYDLAAPLPFREDSPLAAASPYGETKLTVERLLQNLAQSSRETGKNWEFIALRYFNPVGAHASGLLGENPRGAPNNLMPFICQVAAGLRSNLQVFGHDYPTRDGTGVRDYIHVVDLAQGHLAALTAFGDTIMKKSEPSGFLALNLGTGRGCSVLEVVKAFELAAGCKLPFTLENRRPGDIAESYADAARAKALLGWEPTLGLARMCEDAWRWQSDNPRGYETATSKDSFS